MRKISWTLYKTHSKVAKKKGRLIKTEKGFFVLVFYQEDIEIPVGRTRTVASLGGWPSNRAARFSLGLPAYTNPYQVVSAAQVLRMSRRRDHERQGRRFNTEDDRRDDRDPRDIEIERLRQRIRELEINPFNRYERQFENSSSESIVNESGGEEFENFFHNEDTPPTPPHHRRHRRTPPSPPRYRRPLRCFKCHGFGHLKRDCPNKQVVAFSQDSQPVYTECEDDEQGEETTIIYPDQGESLILQRALTTALPEPGDDTNL
ncbi:reverse transcriptase domain, Zinc finger, CCHC-type, Aspartic peptidase domain protein [Artemisia annua]|uniref:Reverse transcriptase domain, Zinc finger, CCHC-type, Aspartic peptidase domain protein n=1 Tax=Artemisia annua TaxID=35608 RepID=A0A2U1LEW1_ARTAN|nr:reverse transcriptase domain, Zinc finger, CCHC-type, Aspartic peptidase domain protein [Artemisia annua]